MFGTENVVPTEVDICEKKYAPYTMETNSIIPSFTDEDHPMRQKWSETIHKEENPNAVPIPLLPTAVMPPIDKEEGVMF